MTEYRRFLVPYDFSVHAQAALERASDLAERLGATLHLVHVVQHPDFALSAFTSEAASFPTDLIGFRNEVAEALGKMAVSLPVQAEAHVVESHRVSDAIVEEARKQVADLVVMGTHGRTGLAHVFLGSVAERTLRDAPCPVLTVKGAEENGGA